MRTATDRHPRRSPAGRLAALVVGLLATLLWWGGPFLAAHLMHLVGGLAIVVFAATALRRARRTRR